MARKQIKDNRPYAKPGDIIVCPGCRKLFRLGKHFCEPCLERFDKERLERYGSFNNWHKPLSEHYKAIYQENVAP